MRPFGRGLFVSLLVIIFIGAAPAPGGCARTKQEGASLDMNPDITTSHPRRMDFRRTVRWSGVAEPRSEVRVLALVAGRITSQRVEDGDKVRRGEVLFTLGGPTIEARLKALDDKIGFVKERVAIKGKDLRVKREALRQNMVRGEEVRAAEDYLGRLEAELTDLEKSASLLRRGLEVRSPVDGVFTGRRVSAGQFVQRGELFGEVLSTGALRLRVSLFSRDGAGLEGSKALVRQRGAQVAEGVVTRVLPRTTKEGATVLWIEGPEIDAAIRPGEPVDGEIILATHRGALSVPADAVVRDETERPFVFVKKGKDYEKRAVRTGMEAEGRVEIRAGLREGDDVVTTGAYELFYRDFGSMFKVAD